MLAIRQLYFDLKKAGDLRKLQIFELEEIRNEAYNNALNSKNRAKLFYGQSIHKKNFVPGQMVLLYNSRLHLFARKLKTRWSRSFLVQTTFPLGPIEIFDPKNGNVFKVNSQRLKPFFTTEPDPHETFELGLYDPVYK